jgi:tetratricopeptide (TPR) repeat protein
MGVPYARVAKRGNALCATIVALSAALAQFPAPSAADAPKTGASTVYGPNPMLSDGATAMMNGDWRRGVELTLLGLSSTLSDEDRAAAYSNLCAGYAALKNFERALENCNRSLALRDDDWRAWQNRAAAHLGLGRVEEALRDVQRGLELNPLSEELHKTLAIARGYERRAEERIRDLVDS